MTQMASTSARVDDALSASDKEGISSAQSDTNSEQNKSAPSHNVQALNDIRACAPKATSKPYFHLSNHSDGCLEISPNPELLTAPPYLNKAIRLPNAGNEFGIFSLPKVGMVQTATALAQSRVCSQRLDASSLLQPLLPHIHYCPIDPEVVEETLYVGVCFTLITKSALQKAKRDGHKLIERLGVGRYHYKFITPYQVKDCQPTDEVYFVPMTMLDEVNATLEEVQKLHPTWLKQPSAEVGAQLYQFHLERLRKLAQKQQEKLAAPKQPKTRQKRRPQNGAFSRLDPHIVTAQEQGLGLASSGAIILKPLEFYQGQPQGESSQADTQKAKPELIPTGADDSHTYEESRKRSIAALREHIVRRLLAKGRIIRLNKKQRQRVALRQEAILNHGYHCDTNRLQIYLETHFKGALTHFDRGVNAQLTPLCIPYASMARDPLPCFSAETYVAHGLLLAADCADLMYGWYELAKTAQAKSSAKKSAQTQDESEAESKLFAPCQHLQQHAMLLLGQLGNFYLEAGLANEIVTSIATAKKLSTDWHKALNQERKKAPEDKNKSASTKTEDASAKDDGVSSTAEASAAEVSTAKTDATSSETEISENAPNAPTPAKPTQAEKLRAQLLEQLQQVKTAAQLQPLVYPELTELVELSADLTHNLGQTPSMAQVQDWTGRCLKLAQSLSKSPLILLHAVPDERMHDAQAATEWLLQLVEFGQCLRAPSHLASCALLLKQCCREEAALVAALYYEPQWQRQPAWFEYLCKLLSKSEVLLQKLALGQRSDADAVGATLHAVKACAQEVNTLCRKACNSVRSQVCRSQNAVRHILSATPERLQPQLHVLAQLNKLQALSEQIVSDLQQDKPQLELVVPLCHELYGLQQFMLRQLTVQDEPCAVLKELDQACYISKLVAHELDFCNAEEHTQALLRGLSSTLMSASGTMALLAELPEDNLSSELTKAFQVTGTSFTAVQQALSVVQSELNTDNLAALKDAFAKLARHYHELSALIAPSYNPRANKYWRTDYETPDRRDDDTKVQAQWLLAPVRSAMALLTALNLAVTPKSNAMPEDRATQLKLAAPLILAEVNKLWAVSTYLEPNKLGALTAPLQQAKEVLTKLSAPTQSETEPYPELIEVLRASLEQAATKVKSLSYQVPTKSTFKPQAAVVRHLSTLDKLAQLIADNPAFEVKFVLAHKLIPAVISLQHDLQALPGAQVSELEALLVQVQTHLGHISKGKVPAEGKVVTLLQQGATSACLLLKEQSHKQSAAHVAALHQRFALMRSRLNARTGYEAIKLNPELVALYHSQINLCTFDIWAPKLQALANTAELAAAFLGLDDKAQATYQLHLYWSALFYRQAHTLKAFFETSHEYFDKKYKKYQGELNQLQQQVADECNQTQPNKNQATSASKKKLVSNKDELETSLAEVKHNLALIQPLFDQVKFFESIAHRRFQRFYAQLVQLKVDLINFVGDRQGSELTDILSFKTPLLTVNECQTVLSQAQDKALKQLNGLISNQNKARGKQRSALNAARDNIKQVAGWAGLAGWDPAKIAEMRTKYLLKQGKLVLVEEKVTPLTSDKSAPKPPNATGDTKDRKSSDHDNLKSEPNSTQDKEEQIKITQVTSDDSVDDSVLPTSNAKGEVKASQGSDHSNLKSEPNVAQDQEEASNEAKPQSNHSETEDKDDTAATTVVRKLTVGTPACDRLWSCAYNREYRSTKNFRSFMSHAGDKGTRIVLSTFMRKCKKKLTAKLTAKLEAKAFCADGGVHQVALPLDVSGNKRGHLWDLIAKRDGKVRVQHICIVYNNVRTKDGRLIKRLTVNSCIPGLPPFASQRVFNAMKYRGIDINDEAAMKKWRECVVAVDPSTQSITVLSSSNDGSKFNLAFKDLLNRENKKNAAKLQQLELKLKQDKRAYSEHMAKINTKFYDENNKRLSNAEVRAKFGDCQEWYDKKALSLNYRVLQDNQEIEQFRKECQFKVICDIIALGGTVIVEDMSYNGLKKRGRKTPSQKEGDDYKAFLPDVLNKLDPEPDSLQPQTQTSADNCGSSTNRANNRAKKAARGKAAASDKRAQQSGTASPGKPRPLNQAAQVNPTGQSRPNHKLNPAKSWSRYGASIGRAAPATFIKRYSFILAKLGGVLIKVPPQLLKATQRNPLLFIDHPKAFQKLKGGISQRYKPVLVPREISGSERDEEVWIQRDFMAAFTLMHAICNKSRISGPSKTCVLNDVDVAACRADWPNFLRAYYYAMKHLWNKGLCSDCVKENLRPSKYDLQSNDWYWGLKAWSKTKKVKQELCSIKVSQPQ